MDTSRLDDSSHNHAASGHSGYLKHCGHIHSNSGYTFYLLEVVQILMREPKGSDHNLGAMYNLNLNPALNPKP